MILDAKSEAPIATVGSQGGATVDYSYLLGHRAQNARHNPQVHVQVEGPAIDLQRISELLRPSTLIDTSKK